MINTGFNPVKEDVDGKKARNIIWTTNILDIALRALEQGKRLVANPFYKNQTKLLKGDLVFERTPEEISEWKRCKDDIIYFVEKYCKLMTPEGVRNVKLRDYQEEYLRHLMKNRLSIMLSARQAGKTTTSAVFMLHYIIFNVDKNALVLGSKRKVSIEILDKLKKIFIELPYFLRPGIYKWNEAEIVLDNGCRIMGESTTINSGISFTFHCVLADEFAHVPPNILDKFYNNLFPTITASRARFMITSTQNGYNLFSRLYLAAVAGENEYKAFKVDWWQIPEWDPIKKVWYKRDEEWKRMQVANYGSEEAFNSQFGTSFDTSANTLISQKILSVKQKNLVEFISKDLPGVPNSECYYWIPDYDPTVELKKDFIIITTDLAEGGGGDYTVAMISRMRPGDKIETIGFFKSNKLNRSTVALSLQYLCSYFCNSDRLLFSFERNTYGELFYKYILDNCDNDIVCMNRFDTNCIVKYGNSDNKKKLEPGVKITSGNKTTTCLLFKESYESGQYDNYSIQFMNELYSFINDGNNHFKAAYGHDDLVMSAIQIEFVKQTLHYRIFKDTYESINSDIAHHDVLYNDNEDYLYYNNLIQNDSLELINRLK